MFRSRLYVLNDQVAQVGQLVYVSYRGCPKWDTVYMYQITNSATLTSLEI
jgi:hypothetical protein